MICRLKPYEGDKPYIFFSYCHEDEKIVYPIVEMLGEAGYRIWYDEGIHAGADWPEVIARHLSACTACMVAISKSSVSSHNCRNEMTFAIEHKKRLVTIQIEDFVLPLGIQLQLASTHQIKMKDYQGDALVLKLKDNDIIKDCIASDDEQRAFFREVSQLDENLTISKQMQIEKVNREAEEFCRTLSETITCDTEAERRRIFLGQPLDDHMNGPQECHVQDEAMCEFFIDDASRLRRIVQLMPDGEPTAEFLNMLWEYAVKHDRLVDLANVLLGFDSKHKTVDGNENCDWYWRCRPPVETVQTNEFFFDLIDYARVRAHLERGTYDDWHGSSVGMFVWMEDYKNDGVGKGIIDIDNVLP